MAEENGELDFGSIEPFAIKVSITGKHSHILREPTKSAVTRYRRLAMKGAKRLPDGTATNLEGAADCEPQIVSDCLFEVKDGPSGKIETQVSLDQLNKWPDRIGSKLFDKIKEMCPHLMGEETVESLTKEKARIERRLVALTSKSEDADEDSPKN